MRVVSLLPAATEMVVELGAADSLVGISHECDFPPAVLHIPRLTSTPVDPAAPGAEIDARVRDLRSAGKPIIGVDAVRLRALDPDLIISQSLCEVCAVSDGVVHRLAAAFRSPPVVLSLEATDLSGIWRDIRLVGSALNQAKRAEELVAQLKSRLLDLTPKGKQSSLTPLAPRVVCIEWLDPLYLAGHWVPELVAAAGGRDVGAEPGAPSRPRQWREIAALRPDVILVMLCGFGLERAETELEALSNREALAVLASVPTWILDGNAYTSRPGPRVVEGAERICAAIRGEAAEGARRWVVTGHSLSSDEICSSFRGSRA